MARRITVSPPDDIRALVTRESVIRGQSEAEFIRQSIIAALGLRRPTPGIFEAEPFAESSRDMAGFGER
jgi:hypothetical protein